MFVTRLPAEDSSSEPKRARMDIQSVLGFSDEDKIGTIQPHDDALVVTLRIGGIWCEESAGRPGQCRRDYVSWPVQGAEFETRGPDGL